MSQIIIKDGTLDKATNKELISATKEVKSKIGEIGIKGKLRSGLSYEITKRGFIIF